MKKSNKTWFFSFTLLSLLLVISSCDTKGKTDLLPHVTTVNSSEITQNSAKSGGNITSDGGSAIISRGVCWSQSASPVIADYFTTDGTGTGAFTSTVTGLASGTTYYVRAYATNSSGIGYGSDIKITTTGNPGIVTDIDGNTYQAVTIGTQTWLSGNLKTTRYRTGESISNVTSAAMWNTATFGAWCDYNNDTVNGKLYGKLYNWAALKDIRNITPEGWHVATQDEWTTLVTFLGGESVAAGKLKETGFTHWKNSATGGSTNEAGFGALPGGSRDPSGAFGSMGDNGYWWTLSENTTTNPVSAWFWYMNYDNSNAHKDYSSKMYGRSVRCVKDKN
jgi:uncharacterized protein (TIGR02145 family)